MEARSPEDLILEAWSLESWRLGWLARLEFSNLTNLESWRLEKLASLESWEYGVKAMFDRS